MNSQELSELLSVLEICGDIDNVSIRDINIAFRKLPLVMHPDKASGEEKEEKTAAFKKLRGAYEIPSRINLQPCKVGGLPRLGQSEQYCTSLQTTWILSPLDHSIPYFCCTFPFLTPMKLSPCNFSEFHLLENTGPFLCNLRPISSQIYY